MKFISNCFLRFFFILVFVLIFVPQAFAKTNIEYILDVSGSMIEQDSGKTRIDLAREALLASLSAIAPENPVALRVYGHRIDKSNKVESCKDTELVIPFGPLNQQVFKDKITPLVPRGYTPIAYSLEQARSDFGAAQELRSIVLLTDGEETCGGDPVAVLQKMKAEGFDVKVNVVGLHIDAAVRSQLEKIAQVSGGQYYDVKNSGQLAQALKDATTTAALLDKTITTYGTAIRGGNSYETAVKIEFNTEYKLDHYQRVNEFDYFFIDLAANQEVTVQMNSLEKGVEPIGPDGKVIENQRPYGGIQLHGAERNRIFFHQIIGQPHEVKKQSYMSPTAGRYYILIGSEYDWIHKDHLTFKVSVVSRGDAATNGDAGDTVDKAIKIQPGRYDTNYFGGSDQVDLFTFDAKKGESYFVGIIPEDNHNPFFNVSVTDEYKQKIFSKMASPGSGIKTDAFVIPEDGTYILRIENQRGNDEPTMKYTLDLKKIEPAAPPTQGL